MGINADKLLHVVKEAKKDCAKLGIALDTEIICARYNAHCEKTGLNFKYDIREMQATLADFIQSDAPENPLALDGCVSYSGGKILKVVVFGPRSQSK